MRLLWSKFLNYNYLAFREWRSTWIDVWRDPGCRWLTISSILLLIISWVIAVVLVSIGDNGLLILHYNIHFGIDLIGQPASIYWLPAGVTAVAVINSFILLLHYPWVQQLRITVLAGSLAVFLLADIALAGLLLINFR